MGAGAGGRCYSMHDAIPLSCGAHGAFLILFSSRSSLELRLELLQFLVAVTDVLWIVSI
jgi:hypothetical protein